MSKGNEFTMTLNKAVDEMFKDNLFVALEIEILEGKRRILPNGQIEYVLMLDDEKADVLKAVMIDMMGKMNSN